MVRLTVSSNAEPDRDVRREGRSAVIAVNGASSFNDVMLFANTMGLLEVANAALLFCTEAF